eukprot:9724567-Alexandrium_andersonii.AAC.1
MSRGVEPCGHLQSNSRPQASTIPASPTDKMFHKLPTPPHQNPSKPQRSEHSEDRPAQNGCPQMGGGAFCSLLRLPGGQSPPGPLLLPRGSFRRLDLQKAPPARTGGTRSGGRKPPWAVAGQEATEKHKKLQKAPPIIPPNPAISQRQRGTLTRALKDIPEISQTSQGAPKQRRLRERAAVNGEPAGRSVQRPLRVPPLAASTERGRARPAPGSCRQPRATRRPSRRGGKGGRSRRSWPALGATRRPSAVARRRRGSSSLPSRGEVGGPSAFSKHKPTNDPKGMMYLEIGSPKSMFRTGLRGSSTNLPLKNRHFALGGQLSTSEINCSTQEVHVPASGRKHDLRVRKGDLGGRKHDLRA